MCLSVSHPGGCDLAVLVGCVDGKASETVDEGVGDGSAASTVLIRSEDLREGGGKAAEG